MSKATESLAKIIQSVIAPLLQGILDPEQFGITTIVNIIVTKDFDYADVYISAWQNKSELKYVLRANVYKVQQALNKKLQRKRVPKIRFFVDHGGEYAQKLEEEYFGKDR